MELTLDAIGREIGKQGGMPDCIECSRYVERDGPDHMSDIEDLLPLFGESKHHVQGRMT